MTLKKIVFFFIVAYGSVLNAQVLDKHSYKFSKALDWINTFYVDTINTGGLVEHAIIEMLHELDPHSAYISREDVADMNEPLQGNFEGIGVTFNILNDTIFIISPISGGPSEKVGIRAGDRIIKIEGENVAGTGIKNSDVISKLRGKKGTKVTVSIKRRKDPELLDFTITRDKIPIYSLDASYMVNDSIGYIRLNRFANTTMQEFEKAAINLVIKNAKHLILDLSGNGGGYLNVAVHLADQFLDKRQMIVYTEGNSRPSEEFFATGDGLFKEGKLVIMIDEGSASASEIVAGAVQDWDRGIIVGRRSFGKGLVQMPLWLPDSSMLRLTIARYYTPTGRLIQKPYGGGYEEYTKDLINRYNSGELSHRDSIHFPESQKFKTLKNHRIVYGGGGIMPDFFIPIDTNDNSGYLRKVINQGILNRFILEYVDLNRGIIKNKYASFSDFRSNYEVSKELLTELSGYAEKNELPKNEEEFERSKERLKQLMKAYIARDVWGTSEFFEIININDPSFNKALEVLTNEDLYKLKLNNGQDKK